jgi:hypothetical protein
MDNLLLKKLPFLVLFLFPLILFGQNDVTQFLGIPIDGTKSELIIKLKEKGFRTKLNAPGVLEGEFNGTDVDLFIVTNNNKARRLAVRNSSPMDESSAKTKFNNLISQFNRNSKYVPTADSILQKYYIPDDEDISRGILLNKKRYQASFYQKSAAYDSIEVEYKSLLERSDLNEEHIKKLSELGFSKFDNFMSSLNKDVWLNLRHDLNGYFITIFYDNKYNEADGEDL